MATVGDVPDLSRDVMSMRSGHTMFPYMDVFNAKKGHIAHKSG